MVKYSVEYNEQDQCWHVIELYRANDTDDWISTKIDLGLDQPDAESLVGFYTHMESNEHHHGQ